MPERADEGGQAAMSGPFGNPEFEMYQRQKLDILHDEANWIDARLNAAFAAGREEERATWLSAVDADTKADALIKEVEAFWDVVKRDCWYSCRDCSGKYDCKDLKRHDEAWERIRQVRLRGLIAMVMRLRAEESATIGALADELEEGTET